MTDDRSHVIPSIVIAGLDPAIHLFSRKMDTRVKPAYDELERSRSYFTTAAV
jgi:hypothetical protein